MITLQSSLSLFRFDPIASVVPGKARRRTWSNPPGHLQVTKEAVVDREYIKGEASPPASPLQA